MTTETELPATLAEVLAVVATADLSGTRRRDMVSAIKRISEMAGTTPAGLAADPSALRDTLTRIRPAAHGLSKKSWSTMRSAFAAALELAGVVDSLGRGRALKDAAWGPLLRPFAHDKRLSNGLAGFANWCAGQGLPPDEVSDEAIQRFKTWIETRTLHPRPRDIVRGVPQLWNEAKAKLDAWPRVMLTPVSFRQPYKRHQWDDLPESFRCDAEAYLAMRAEPDIFDERPYAPRRPLAASTLRLQRDHLRLAASILVESGVDVAEIRSLADLVLPENFKTVLRYYHDRAEGKPCAFVVSLSKALIDVARFHVGITAEPLATLKRIAANLPAVPYELTPKNQAFLRKLESNQLRAKLHFLPEALLDEVARGLDKGRLRFVDAQVAIAIDILLAVPLRCQNLSRLHWRRHFVEPNGPKGHLLLHIPAEEMKTNSEYTAEIPDDVARRLRWYRRTILPRLGGDPNGDLFVSRGGKPKLQDTLTDQIIKTITNRVGITMSPHQFRHLAGSSYLAANPKDFETVKGLLGHASAKSTRIYVGSESRRSTRVYSQMLLEQRATLKLHRIRKNKRTRAKRSGKTKGPRPCKP